ncbi:MAG: glycosyltransferase family 4 protein [Porphyromonas somerae]|uniref:glycosyltransferase family 4 protein n=1 Tax=Porphyromonas somerae TaxID=322095 RepID=UPI0026EF43F9|nr:glycosyltransferase family 4 protein [Porphyromonas somerae]MDD7558569.1 glycosyltransferase family 4 protein [Porphyromonas somerae]MDY5815496.1 glycosyltransferase family 4 protein [Porphyromonas somerae]
MTPHILHLANDFPHTRVYSELVKAIDNQGIQQTVFTTIRKEEERDRNRVDFVTDKSTIHYIDNWRPWYRLLFRVKTHSNYKQLLQHVDIKEITHIHAHTLFSDGALALQLNKDYGIPYTVTIRNTDINTFMRFLIHTWNIGKKVIQNADKVLCISPAHIERVKHWVDCPTAFTQKAINIPNGINSYWLEHLSCDLRDRQENDPWHILYIGNFSPNKNLPRLMQAVLNLINREYNIQLHIIGGKGKDTNRIETIAKKHSDTFHLYGTIQDREKIRNIMRQCHFFAMPSLTETFGLVYVEALSQGLPILYTKGEGVDGFFNSKYGVPCVPQKVSSISDAIEELMTNYHHYKIDPEFLAKHFSWDKIALQYIRLANK